MKKFFPVLYFLLSGCGVYTPLVRNEKTLKNLELGMDVDSVVESIGEPDATRGSIKLENGQVVRVDEYRLYPTKEAYRNFLLGIITLSIGWWIPPESDNPYLLQFTDGKLDKWERASDWQADISHDVKIR